MKVLTFTLALILTGNLFASDEITSRIKEKEDTKSKIITTIKGQTEEGLNCSYTLWNDAIALKVKGKTITHLRYRFHLPLQHGTYYERGSMTILYQRGVFEHEKYTLGDKRKTLRISSADGSLENPTSIQFLHEKMSYKPGVPNKTLLNEVCLLD